jgi:serine/threonine protein kinase
MLSSHEYAKSVDVWSCGCTLGEVLTGKILFPGQHYIEQINLIINLRGSPDEETRKSISNDYALKYVESLPQKTKVPLQELIPNAPPEILDLLDKMLDLNAFRRITVEEALKHPFLASLHEEEDEPVFTGTIDFSFEVDTTLDLVKIQRLIMKEIAFYNPAYYELSAPQ